MITSFEGFKTKKKYRSIEGLRKDFRKACRKRLNNSEQEQGCLFTDYNDSCAYCASALVALAMTDIFSEIEIEHNVFSGLIFQWKKNEIYHLKKQHYVVPEPLFQLLPILLPGARTQEIVYDNDTMGLTLKQIARKWFAEPK